MSKEKRISASQLADILFDAQIKAERFKAGTGKYPPDEPQQWYAWGVELFGEVARNFSIPELQDLIYGKLSLEKDQPSEKPDFPDPDYIENKKALDLWNSGKRWPEVAEEIRQDREQGPAIREQVKRFARKYKLPIRTGKRGSPKKNE